jgi:DNA-binding transcriptional LysR family regulator
MVVDSTVMYPRLFAKAGLSLDRLRTFREIVNAGGLSAAAGDDPNRQSQFSRQLRELEHFFGSELIQRGRGPLRLTAAGQRLNQVAGITLRGLEDFLDECAGTPTDIVVGAGESLIQWWLLPRLPRIGEMPAQVSLTFENRRNDDALASVRDGSLDFGVVSRVPRDTQLMTALLGRLEFRLFVPDRLLGEKPPGDSKILHNLPLAELSAGGQLAEAVRAEARRRRISLQNRLMLSSYPQMARAVADGRVAAVLPALAAEALADSKVTAVSLPFLDRLARSVTLVWNRQLLEVRPGLGTVAKLLSAAWRVPHLGLP